MRNSNHVSSIIDQEIIRKDQAKGLHNLIYVKDLSLWHGKQQTLKNVELNIRDKGITVLLGPSGCGKTTLLKTFNRLSDLYPDIRTEGSIFFEGKDILSKEIDVYDLRQKMGLLSQRPQPLPGTIAENIRYALKLKGIKAKSEQDDRIAHYLQKVALWEEVKDRLKSPAGRLSIGQQQRLCLARGLAIEPRVILADEPTSALDPISSRKIEEQFKELSQEFSIVLVTHILRQAKRLADYVAFMYFGEVIEKGRPDVLFEDPKTETFKEYLFVGH
ncbi:Phosphate transport ATP-binding protein PstB [Fulvivirga imtechensis AK7]|uniref:Phosphate transport ATP-binding protein PstB n=1 Tax=Fulvivirga imtechensis AK7 TaxID=1237149 RepID=L8K1P3_9BACT|nr:phosphate ABC transporter ATP-binding protein [Fulvivirga imtechensis]ELR73372.1 Phosphate transport ATP-binding protein PstB [Fulvivirga imtechensis AK7]